MFRRASSICVLLISLAATVVAADDKGAVPLLPSAGGWAMTDDNETLIVSLPAKKQLVYFDMVGEKEVKRVDVGFPPTSLTLQGKTLFAAVKDAALVYALEADSGSQKKKIKLPGDPALHLACNPESGPVYLSTAKHRIFAVDPATGKVARTKARGLLLAADPKGSALYTGMIQPYRERIKVVGGKEGELTVEFDNNGRRGTLLKYAPAGKDLKLVDGNPNAAIGAGGALAISPDGQRIVFVAGGGWQPLSRKDRSGPVVFSADDLKTAVGAVACQSPSHVAFHPILNVGAILDNGVNLTFFDTKSLAIRKKTSVNAAPHGASLNLLAFGGKGTKVVYLLGERLVFIPIALTEKERAALTEVYGKLPEEKGGE